MTQYLAETDFFNFSHPRFQNWCDEVFKDLGDQDQKEKIIRLYYAVRDGWKYFPYRWESERSKWQTSYIFELEKCNCIDKSMLMIAGARYAGVPARISFAKVKNHISTEKILEFLKSDEIVPHGIVEVFLNDKWVRATPAFNKELCDFLNVQALDFDGTKDSIFQEFDKAGGVFMTYLENYGSFDDIPLDFLNDIMQKHYPHLFDQSEFLGLGISSKT